MTVQGADTGDTTVAAAAQIEDAQAEVDDPQAFTALVADKGYHSNEVMVDLQAVGVRSYVAEPDRGRRDWSKAREAQAPVYANRRRIRGARGKRLMRRRGERIERSFAHAYETGGMRRTHLRNISDQIIDRGPLTNDPIAIPELDLSVDGAGCRLKSGVDRGGEGRSPATSSPLVPAMLNHLSGRQVQVPDITRPRLLPRG